jgi:hypothetical protein
MKQKQLFEICLSGTNHIFYEYIVAKNENEAMQKAKKLYPYSAIVSAYFFKEIYI